MIYLRELRRLNRLDNISSSALVILVVTIDAGLRNLLVCVAVLHQLRKAAAVHLRLLLAGRQMAALGLHVLAHADLVFLQVLRLVSVDLNGMVTLILTSRDQLRIDVDFVTIV